ncbi:MAG TPA: tRNA (guanosine(37)-N1)-methyltransferase TrmD [Terriglobales bacterium]|nr:tRNA (guanosine(37)-N1)-methyltransferase TrmD [Terriglobales bacterium]
MKFEIITIFPDFFAGPFTHGIVSRAEKAGLVGLGVRDLRVHTRDRHKTVDDRPFGGGEGMVLKPEPIFKCVEALGVASREARMQPGSKETVVLLSPQGRIFNQGLAEELAQMERVILICGRYEGVDERVSMELADQEISVGDFVISGGELGAAIVVDAVTRLIPGALGNEASSQQESFSSRTEPVAQGVNVPSSTCTSGGLLDYPHYTRPAEFRGMEVPEVLSSGNHEEIRKWRRQRALEKTLRNRPDLLEKVALSEEDQKFIAGIRNGAGR